MKANLKTHQCVLSERDQVFQDNLEYFAVGATVRGTVKQVENYGAFVSLELADGKEHGIFGMVHKSEISWDTAQGPVDVVKVGEVLWSCLQCCSLTSHPSTGSLGQKT